MYFIVYFNENLCVVNSCYDIITCVSNSGNTLYRNTYNITLYVTEAATAW